jgi:hypothetical protein
MDHDTTFDSPAEVRAMKMRHASLGRRTLEIVDYALREWELKIKRGEALNLSVAEIIELRAIGMKMAAQDGGADAEVDPRKVH